MKSVIVLNTESDSSKADVLKNFLQGKLQTLANLTDIGDILVEERDFMKQLRRSDCVLLIASRQASHLLQNKHQETDGEFVTLTER